MSITCSRRAHESADVTRICAHQQALAQCRNWLDQHWPTVSARRSAAMVRRRGWRRDPGVAAVAGDMAASLMAGQARQHIEDYPDNTTRFLDHRPRRSAPQWPRQDLYYRSSRNKPGALFTLLDPFRTRRVSLTRIDTRPVAHREVGLRFLYRVRGHVQDEISPASVRTRRAIYFAEASGVLPAAVL